MLRILTAHPEENAKTLLQIWQWLRVILASWVNRRQHDAQADGWRKEFSFGYRIAGTSKRPAKRCCAFVSSTIASAWASCAGALTTPSGGSRKFVSGLQNPFLTQRKKMDPADLTLLGSPLRRRERCAGGTGYFFMRPAVEGGTMLFSRM
jgi:hypothetical protein